MAYIKIFPIKVTDKKALDYITNPDKTRLCRKVIEAGKSAPNQKAYQSRHQAEYQLHD